MQEHERFSGARITEKIPPFYSFSLFEKAMKAATRQAETNAYNATRRKYKTLASSDEYSLGIYINGIQPQIKNAVLTIHKKGYQLYEWGFAGLERETQYMDGIFRIQDKETKKKLSEIDVKIDEYEFEGLKKTEIYFKPVIPDFKEVKAKWDRVAEILPDTAAGPQSRWHPDAFDFRKSHYFLTSAYIR